MSLNYYEPQEVQASKLVLISKVEPLEGLVIRNLGFPSGAEVTHLQETLWPDNKPPTSYERIKYIIDFIAKRREERPESPVIIHCSAGVGRTGTLIAIYTLIEALQHQLKLCDAEVSVFGVVRRLREQRWGMVRNQH